MFVGVYLILGLLASRISQVNLGEKRLLLAVAISCPFLAVRLVYALISVFANSMSFNPTFGNITIFLCMDVLEEIVVVAVCVVIGLTLRIVPKAIASDAEANTDLQQNENLDPRQSDPSTMRSSRRSGPITMLFGATNMSRGKV